MPPLILGHRGASAVAPENTRAAFERAFRDGADGIELDVTLSRDGVPVVIHDDTLDRTTDGRGAVWDRDLADLRRLDAGGWFGAGFRGERIPTLAEALDLARGRGIVNVEIKHGRGARMLVDPVVRVLKAHGREDGIVVSSFDPRILRRLRARDRRWRTAFLRSGGQRRPLWLMAAYAAADFLHPDVRLSETAAKVARGWGRIVVWTVDDEPTARTLAARGVRGLITNRPAEVAGWLRGRL